jgi:hypothetical protein
VTVRLHAGGDIRNSGKNSRGGLDHAQQFYVEKASITLTPADEEPRLRA